MELNQRDSAILCLFYVVGFGYVDVCPKAATVWGDGGHPAPNCHAGQTSIDTEQMRSTCSVPLNLLFPLFFHFRFGRSFLPWLLSHIPRLHGRMNRYPQKVRFQIDERKHAKLVVDSFCMPDTTSRVGWPGATKKALLGQASSQVARFRVSKELFDERTLIPYIDNNLNPHQSCDENFGLRWHDFLRISASSVCVAHGITMISFFGYALFLPESTIVTVFL